METKLRRKKISSKEEAEELETDQQSGEWLLNEEEGEARNLSGDSEESDENSRKNEDKQDNLYMILAEAKRRNQDREMQTDPSSETI